MGRLLQLLSGRNTRVLAANNCNLPNSYNTIANWVNNCWTTHISGPTGYTQIEATFINGLVSTNSESNAHYDFYLRAGLLLNGTFYQFLFNGSNETLVAKEWGTATGVCNVTIPPNTVFKITNRRVAADGGAAGSYNVITSTSGIAARQDGIISGTDNTKDFTLGVGVAYGATITHPPTINNGTGAITAATVANGGTGYTSGPNLIRWYGPAESGSAGATHPGTGASGFGNRTGSAITSITISGGGTGHNSANPVELYLGGGGGFGAGNQASYGPSFITGKPSSSPKSILMIGDSIVAGYGSVDGTGDLRSSHGFMEQILSSNYGLAKFAVSGESAAGWILNNTKQLALFDAQKARGVRFSHVIIVLGTNDFLNDTAGTALTTLETKLTSMVSTWRSRGAKVLLATLPPSTTSTDSWATTANQTATNTNFASGGLVEQFNSRLLAGTGVANDGVIDYGTMCRDATSTWKWRVNAYGSNPFTGDGTHPSKAVGIPYLVANLNIAASLT